MTRYFKPKPNDYLAKTWHDKLSEHEIERNSFHATGKLKESREFADAVMHLESRVKTLKREVREPVVIFTRPRLEDMPLSSFLSTA